SIGSWFKGAAELRGQGVGRAPSVFVSSGRADLGRADFGKGGGGAGGGSAIEVALDRLNVTDKIALTGFRGSFTTRGG
ncbi:MAG: hypothetical protein KDJ82_09045, partial [Rhodobacteraceae bacterium]|nr:hypothetical protein [Paracoccaceae bacterium]